MSSAFYFKIAKKDLRKAVKFLPSGFLPTPACGLMKEGEEGGLHISWRKNQVFLFYNDFVSREWAKALGHQLTKEIWNIEVEGVGDENVGDWNLDEFILTICFQYDINLARKNRDFYLSPQWLNSPESKRKKNQTVVKHYIERYTEDIQIFSKASHKMEREAKLLFNSR